MKRMICTLLALWVGIVIGSISAHAVECTANGTFCCTCNNDQNPPVPSNFCTQANSHLSGATWSCQQIKQDCEEQGACIGSSCGTMRYYGPGAATMARFPWLATMD